MSCEASDFKINKSIGTDGTQPGFKSYSGGVYKDATCSKTLTQAIVSLAIN